MCTKIFYKGVKYLSHMLVVKDRELEFEIGHPTDVKHVAHIGADGIGGNAAPPSWMNGFKNGPDFSATSAGSLKEKQSPRSSDSNESECKADGQTAQKKHRRKKTKTTFNSETSGTKGMQQA